MRVREAEREKAIHHEVADTMITAFAADMALAGANWGDFRYRGYRMPRATHIDRTIFHSKDASPRSHSDLRTVLSASLLVLSGTGGAATRPELIEGIRTYAPWSKGRLTKSIERLVKLQLLEKRSPKQHDLGGNVVLIRLSKRMRALAFYKCAMREQLDIDSHRSRRFILTGKDVGGVTEADYEYAMKWSAELADDFFADPDYRPSPKRAALFRHRVRQVGRAQIARSIAETYAALNNRSVSDAMPFGEDFQIVFWACHYLLHFGPRAKRDLEIAISYRYYLAKDAFLDVIARALDYGLVEHVERVRTGKWADTNFRNHSLKADPVMLSPKYRHIMIRYSLGYEMAVSKSWERGLMLEQFAHYGSDGYAIARARDNYWDVGT